MPKLYLSKTGASYPATLADYKRARSGQKAKVKWAEAEPGVAIPAPYPELVASWLANGFEEVSADAVPEREGLR
jgi:hypothetical protein